MSYKTKTNSIDSSGDHARIGSSDNLAQIDSSGVFAQIGSSGNSSQVNSKGKYAQIGSSGNLARINSKGKYAQIGSSGDYAEINSEGKYAVICCAGNISIAKGKIGSWITLSEWQFNEEEGSDIPVCVKAEKIDGVKIKEDTYYRLVNGEFIEA